MLGRTWVCQIRKLSLVSFSDTDVGREARSLDEEEEEPSDMVAAASTQMCLEVRGSDTISICMGCVTLNWAAV